MGKVKKRTKTGENFPKVNSLQTSRRSYAQSVRSTRVAASIRSRKSMKSNIFEELQLDTAEMEEELEDTVIKQLSSHKEWLLNKKNNNKKKNKNNNKNDKNNNNKNNDNLVSALNSLNALNDNSMDIDANNNDNNNNNNNNCGDDYDTRTVITSKSFKGLGLRKEQKKKLKKEIWLKKISLTEKHLNNNKLSIMQETKSPLFDDFTSIHQSLTTVKWVNDGFRDKTSTKPRSIEKAKTIQQKMKDDLNNFNATSVDPSYMESPFETVKLKLMEKIQQRK